MGAFRRVFRSSAALGTLLAFVSACIPPSEPDLAPGVTVEMDATISPLDPDFFSMPWPNGIRRTADGHLDLFRFPGSTASPVLAYLVAQVGAAIEGFGTQTAVYLRLTGAVDPSSLPGPSGSLDPGASIQLVERHDPSHRVPVVVRAEPADGFRGTNLLSLLPYPGHTLRPDTEYLAVVTRGVRSADGERLRPARLIDELDSPTWVLRARSAADWAELRAQRDDARAALEAGGAWEAADLVGFTGFRTQDSTAEMAAVSTAIDGLELPAPQLLLLPCMAGERTTLAFGTVQVPLFQGGYYPYLTTGGEIRVDGGSAVLQRWQPMDIELQVPCGDPPPGGWPIQTFLNGTGGGPSVSNAPGASDRAILGSIPPLYGEGSPYVDDTETTYYNAFNPIGARGNQIQQAADNLVLIRVLQDLRLDGAPLGSSTTVTTDDTAISISGQSQGAQTLPLVAWAEPEVDAVIAGAGGAGYYNQISQRRSIRERLAQFAGRIDDYDIRNPIAQLIDTLVDDSEAANFPNRAHYLDIVGEDDTCLTLESARHLAGSQGLALVGARLPAVFGDDALEPARLQPPVSGNAAGRTRVMLELPGGHFNAFANQSLATSFAEAALGGGVPVVDGPFLSSNQDCPDQRYGPFGSD